MGVPVIFLLSRFRPTIRRAMLVAAAGFVGMIVETVLIIYYQAKYGVLYQNIGLLLMSFMAGLVAGSFLINKAHRQFGNNSKSFRFYGIGLLIGFCILCLFIELNVLKGNFTGLPQISSLLAINGFLVAGIFAYVSLHEIEEQKKIISPLYAADLVGGCIGSLLGSLILIPLVGMDITARAMFLVAAFSFLLL
jgi:spermidine synthase